MLAISLGSPAVFGGACGLVLPEFIGML